MNFTGKASRPDYWWVALVNAIYVIILAPLIWYIFTSQGGYSVLSLVLIVISFLLFLASYIPSISLLTRRLNDLGIAWQISLSLIVVDIVTNFIPTPLFLDGVLGIVLLVLPFLPTGIFTSKSSTPHQGNYLDFNPVSDDTKADKKDDIFSNPF